MHLLLMVPLLATAAVLPDECRMNGVCTRGMDEGPCWYIHTQRSRDARALPSMWIMINPAAQPALAALGCPTFEKLGHSRLSTETVLGYGVYDGKNVTCPATQDFVCCASGDSDRCTLSRVRSRSTPM